MDLLLTDEQRLLQDGVARMLAQAGGVKRTRALRGKDGGFDRAMHARMGQEGWFGLLVPEGSGGAGLGLTELGLVLMEAGRTLAPEPIGASAVVARVIAHGAYSSKTCAGILDGRMVVMPAISSQSDGSGLTWHMPRKETGVRLDGRIVGIPWAASCDGFLVEAPELGGSAVVAEDPMLAYVPRSTPGLTISPRATVDGRPFADLAFAGVKPELVLLRDSAHGAYHDLLLFAAAAELVGVMSAALDITVEYLKTRKQFGKPIGSFQALQHRAVDDFARIVSARSFLFQVAAQGLDISPAMASALKAHAGHEALAVCKSAIQMHGGIGFTEECDIGLYLKRAMWLSAWLGNEAHHRARYASLMG